MSEQRSFLGRFFGFIGSLVVFAYRLIFIGLFLAILVGIWMALRGGPAPVVEEGVALVIWPTGALVEQDDQDPGSRYLQQFTGEPPAQTSLRDLVEALERAANDSRIPLAVLKVEDLWSAGLPQIEELTQAMRTFRAAGKPIYVHGSYFGQLGYLAASQADDVSLDPQGAVLLEGFDAYTHFFKEGLDKLGVTVNVFRVGEYKSAVEPYTRNDMSAESKAANLEWLGDLWRNYGTLAGAGRKLPAEAMDSYVRGTRAGVERLGGDLAAYARDAGLVNRLETLEQFRGRVGEQTGMDEEHGSFRQIHFADYLAAVVHEQGAGSDKQKLALVVVQGDLVDGDGGPGVAGGDGIAALLDEARRDDDVAAVILRVDSPGGSVWASEQVRRAVQALQADDKPVVASMSTLAASGGYWVSMDADRIIASPSTITGSIGIFGLIPTLDQPLAKLGIHTDGVGTTPLAGALRTDRPLTDEVKAIIQAQIDKGYRDFISGVAAGREMAVAKVDEIARGRVWSGEDAKALGLVDELGGYAQAVDAAAELAGLKAGEYRVEPFLPEPAFDLGLLGFFSRMGLGRLPGVEGWVQTALREVGERGDLQSLLRAFNDPRGMYAHCECSPSLTRER